MKSREQKHKRIRQITNSSLFNYVVAIAGLAFIVVIYTYTQKGAEGGNRFQEQQFPPEIAIDFTVVAEGSEAYGYSNRQGQVIATRAEWETLWNTLHLATIPRPAVPEVDFAQQRILVVFAGKKSGNGYMVIVKKVVEVDKKVIVYAVERRSASSQQSEPQPSFPFQIVTIPNSEWPVSFIFQ